MTENEVTGAPLPTEMHLTDQVKVKEPETDALNSEVSSKKTIIGIIIGVIIILALIIGGVIGLLSIEPAETARIRDIFIIFMALQTLLTGFVLVILIIQLSRLINLLQNEIKPILDSTNETVSHLRGTTLFLSNNLVQPVIKLNEYLAGITQLMQVIGLVRKSPKSK